MCKSSLVAFGSQPLTLILGPSSGSYVISPLPCPSGFLPSVDPNDQKKTACYDIDVEVDDTLKTQMNSFLLSTASQQEIATLDNKVGAPALGSLGASSPLPQLIDCLLILSIGSEGINI